MRTAVMAKMPAAGRRECRQVAPASVLTNTEVSVPATIVSAVVDSEKTRVAGASVTGSHSARAGNAANTPKTPMTRTAEARPRVRIGPSGWIQGTLDSATPSEVQPESRLPTNGR